MEKPDFKALLARCSQLSLDFAKNYVEDDLPDNFIYNVVLNVSSDDPELKQFDIYSEDNDKKLFLIKAEEIVDLLCRNGKVPVWINISVEAVHQHQTVFALLCAGRYSADPDEFYYTKSETACFGIKSPILPIDYVEGTKFRMTAARLAGFHWLDTPKRYHYPSPGFARYWESGHGKKLAASLKGGFPDERQISRNVPLLFETDQLADQVVREVIMANGFPKTMDWIAKGLNNVNAEEIPAPLRQMIDFSLKQPHWLDLTKLENGARLCRRAGAAGLLVLRNYCLMGGYESSAINKPLFFTEALKKGAAKRMAETTEFWVKVVGENALSETVGLKECITVRLMHAFARVSILDRSDWKTDEWGQPLNQWDMIATNLGFSILFLNGLRLLGMKPTDEEIEGLFHFWKYVGYLLGIPAELLPGNESQAIQLLYSWTITQPPADADTKALARALMNEPLTSNYPSKMWQKKRVVQMHLGYNYFFLGKASCEAMGLPSKGWTIYPAMMRLQMGIQEMKNRFSSRARQKSILKNRRQQENIAFIFLKGHGRK